MLHKNEKFNSKHDQLFWMKLIYELANNAGFLLKWIYRVFRNYVNIF